jgi:hypothetical protein
MLGLSFGSCRTQSYILNGILSRLAKWVLPFHLYKSFGILLIQTQQKGKAFFSFYYAGLGLFLDV